MREPRTSVLRAQAGILISLNTKKLVEELFVCCLDLDIIVVPIGRKINLFVKHHAWMELGCSLMDFLNRAEVSEFKTKRYSYLLNNIACNAIF